MPAKVDLNGMVFGRLTVLSFAGHLIEGTKQRKRRLWCCQCECGKTVNVPTSNLTSGNSTSCGCMRFGGKPGNPTHGQSRTFEHRVWKGMRQRCLNPLNAVYRDYGGRGIRICERWDSFENFLADMGPVPGPKHSIERKDPNGNYEPDNCVWLPKRRQSRNRRDTIRLAFNGETKPLIEWAEHLGLSYKALRARRDRGWTDEQILTTPVHTVSTRPRDSLGCFTS